MERENEKCLFGKPTQRWRRRRRTPERRASGSSDDRDAMMSGSSAGSCDASSGDRRTFIGKPASLLSSRMRAIALRRLSGSSRHAASSSSTGKPARYVSFKHPSSVSRACFVRWPSAHGVPFACGKFFWASLCGFRQTDANLVP